MAPRLLAAARRAYAQHVRLHQLHRDRHDVSGLDALAATRALHWVGPRLVGDLLPSPGVDAHRR